MKSTLQKLAPINDQQNTCSVPVFLFRLPFLRSEILPFKYSIMFFLSGAFNASTVLLSSFPWSVSESSQSISMWFDHNFSTKSSKLWSITRQTKYQTWDRVFILKSWVESQVWNLASSPSVFFLTMLQLYVIMDHVFFLKSVYLKSWSNMCSWTQSIKTPLTVQLNCNNKHILSFYRMNFDLQAMDPLMDPVQLDDGFRGKLFPEFSAEPDFWSGSPITIHRRSWAVWTRLKTRFM